MEKKTNFRAQFTLTAKYDNPSNRFYLLRTISNWINNKNSNEKTKDTILKGLIAGKLDFHRDNLDINCRSISGKFTQNSPEYLAISHSHPDSSEGMSSWRTWTNEIGLQKIDENVYLFSLTNSYQIKSGYIGYVTEPTITSPNIIKQLINSEYWTASVSGIQVGLDPVLVDHYNVKDFIALVFNSERAVPLIYISRDIENNLPLNPKFLSNKVAGNAIVFYEEDKSVGRSHTVLPKFQNYRCSNGMVRVYLPGVNSENPYDAKRHRFFSFESIIELSPEEVISIIAESLVRRSIFIRPFKVQCIKDLDRIAIEIKLSEAIASQKDETIIQTYKEQVDVLNNQLTEKEKEIDEYCSLYDQAVSDSGLFKDEIKNLKRDNFNLAAQLQQYEIANPSEQYQTYFLEKVPTKLIDLIELAELYYNQKIVFLQEAKDSAEGYDLNDLNKAWKALKSIAEVLHPIMFHSEGDKKADYHSKTGFDIAMTESKMTKGDKKLAAQRLRIYNGEKIDISPHIGYGTKKPNMLRIHFYVSNSEKKIIIGHCGDHLDNFSTKNIS